MALWLVNKLQVRKIYFHSLVCRNNLFLTFISAFWPKPCLILCHPCIFYIATKDSISEKHKIHLFQFIKKCDGTDMRMYSLWDSCAIHGAQNTIIMKNGTVIMKNRFSFRDTALLRCYFRLFLFNSKNCSISLFSRMGISGIYFFGFRWLWRTSGLSFRKFADVVFELQLFWDVISDFSKKIG